MSLSYPLSQGAMTHKFSDIYEEYPEPVDRSHTLAQHKSHTKRLVFLEPQKR